MTEGPRTITPRKYKNCDGCNYVEKVRASTGGLKGAPTYYMSCEHPEIMELAANSDLIPPGRSVNKRGSRGENPLLQRTPMWCPYIQGIK